MILIAPGVVSLSLIHILIMTTLIVMVAAAFLYLGLNDLSMGMATGLLFQGMMLLPPGLKITGYLDNLLNIVFLKKGR